MWNRAAAATLAALLVANCDRAERAPAASAVAPAASGEVAAKPGVDCPGLIVFEPGIDLTVSDYAGLSSPVRSSPVKLADGGTATLILRVFDMEDERPSKGEVAAVGVVMVQSDRSAPVGGTLWAHPDKAHFDSFEVPSAMTADAASAILAVRPNSGNAGPCRSGLVLRLDASGDLAADGVKVASVGRG